MKYKYEDKSNKELETRVSELSVNSTIVAIVERYKHDLITIDEAIEQIRTFIFE